MTLRLSTIPRDPYLGYEPQRVAGQAACEGLALPRWFMERDEVEAARISDAITDAYS